MDQALKQALEDESQLICTMSGRDGSSGCLQLCRSREPITYFPVKALHTCKLLQSLAFYCRKHRSHTSHLSLSCLTMDWLRGSGGDSNTRNPSAASRPGQSPAPPAGRSGGYSSVSQYNSSNSGLPAYGGQQQQPPPALPSRGQRPPPQYNNAPGGMPGQMEARGAGVGGQFEVVPTPVDSLVPRNVSHLIVSPDQAK